jgi:hypothetical protein
MEESKEAEAKNRERLAQLQDELAQTIKRIEQA